MTSDDLARKVQDKVRQKWGGPKPKPKPPDLKAPKIIDLELESSGVCLHGLVTGIERLARMDSDMVSFLITLSLNGCKCRLKVSVSGQALAVMKHESVSKGLMAEIVNRADVAMRELIKAAILKDLNRLARPGGEPLPMWLE